MNQIGHETARPDRPWSGARLAMLQRLTLALCALLAWAPAHAAEAEAAVAPPAWWQATTGILGIPTAIVGLAYSYVLIRKTHLEVRKTELENRKLELEIAASGKPIGAAEQAELEAVIRPIYQRKAVNFILVRFVLFALVVAFWGAFESLISLSVNALFYLGGRALGHDLFSSNGDHPEMMFVIAALVKLPQIAYAIVILAIGAPLFRDCNKMLGIDLLAVFRPSPPNKGA
jgi:hypothetical protein